jgi:steroid delta-isomerase-like uncharacterized protein
MLPPQKQTEYLIEDYYATFNSGDREAFLALLADDVRHDINQGGQEMGVATFRAFLQRMDRCYREQVEDLVVMANTTGQRASAEFYIRGEYLVADEGLPAASGQKYHLRVGAFFEVHANRITRVTNYYNLQDWLAQVAASEPPQAESPRSAATEV